jgi:hypothetical protein
MAEKITQNPDNQIEELKNQEITSVLSELAELKKIAPQINETNETQDPPNLKGWFESSENLSQNYTEDSYRSILNNEYEFLDLKLNKNLNIPYKSVSINKYTIDGKISFFVRLYKQQSDMQGLSLGHERDFESLSECENFILNANTEKHTQWENIQNDLNNSFNSEYLNKNISELKYLDSYLYLEKTSFYDKEDENFKTYLYVGGKRVGNFKIEKKDDSFTYSIEDNEGKIKRCQKEELNPKTVRKILLENNPSIFDREPLIKSAFEMLDLILTAQGLDKYDVNFNEIDLSKRLIKFGSVDIKLPGFTIFEGMPSLYNNEAKIKLGVEKIHYEIPLLKTFDLTLRQNMTPDEFIELHQKFLKVIRELPQSIILDSNRMKQIIINIDDRFRRIKRT